MPKTVLSRLNLYLLAVLSVALIAAIRLLIEQGNLAVGRPYLLFALSILLASWWGGIGPGLLATILSMLTIDFLFLEPRYRFGLDGGAELVPELLFCVQGVFISILGHIKIRAIDALRESRDQLEHRVDQRTRELRDLNAALTEQMEENRLASEELRQQADALGRSNRELQDFASVASHDLQEPLRKILAFGDRLRSRAGNQLGEEGSDYLTRMQNAAGRMQVLINDLLTFSRVTTRAQPFTEVDLGLVAEGVVSDLETRIEQTAGRVELGDLPTLDADPTQMRQLLQNLIGNGLKFHRPGEPPVIRITSVPLEPVDNAAPAFRIEVSDNGIGFDEKYLDRIFNIFQRLHGRGVYEGTGVGLAVCRKIVERHGGTISARSRPGEGATFVVTLPRRQHLIEETDEPSRAADHHPVGR